MPTKEPTVATVWLLSYAEGVACFDRINQGCGTSYNVSQPEPYEGRWKITIRYIH